MCICVCVTTLTRITGSERALYLCPLLELFIVRRQVWLSRYNSVCRLSCKSCKLILVALSDAHSWGFWDVSKCRWSHFSAVLARPYIWQIKSHWEMSRELPTPPKAREVLSPWNVGFQGSRDRSSGCDVVNPGHKQQEPDKVPVVSCKSRSDEVTEGSRRCCKCLVGGLGFTVSKAKERLNSKQSLI